MLNLFWEIIKDQRGIWPWVIPAITTAVSAGIGAMSDKGEEDKEIYDPYAGLRGDWLTRMQGKLGSRTPYQDNPAFDIQQPEVESAAQRTILGKLGNLPTSADYSKKLEASKTQQISREKERAASQQEEEANMYNRLGLVSSTPWLTRAGELGEESLGRQKDIETGMDVYGLEYGLKADTLADQIAKGWTGLGTVLGGQQAGYQQYSQKMSEADLERMTQEEQFYDDLIGSLLGTNPAQRNVTKKGDDIFSTLGGIGTQFGTEALLKAILGGE